MLSPRLFIITTVLLSMFSQNVAMEGEGSWVTTKLYSTAEKGPGKKRKIATKFLKPCLALELLTENGAQEIPLASMPDVDLKRLIRCLKDKEKWDANTDTQKKLYSMLMAANYVGHEQLLVWCQQKWAEKKYEADYELPFPMELDTVISKNIIKKTPLPKELPQSIAKSIFLKATATFKSDNNNSLWSCAFDSMGTSVATGDGQGWVKVYSPHGDGEFLNFQAHGRGISTIAFNESTSQIATCARDGSIKFWNSGTQQLEHTINTNPRTPFVFRIHPNGSLIAYDENNFVKLYNTDTGSNFALVGHQAGMVDIAFNHNGSLLASGGHDNKVKLWDVATRKCIKTFGRHTDSIFCVQFSPDSTLLAAGSVDNTITIYDLNTKKLVATLQGHTRPIWSVWFSDNNEFLFSGAQDNSIKTWHIPTKKCIKTINRHKSDIQSMSMLPDGKLATVSHRGFLNLWDTKKLTDTIAQQEKQLLDLPILPQALFVADAYTATAEKPVDCNTRFMHEVYDIYFEKQDDKTNNKERVRRKVYETFSPEIQKILAALPYVQAPVKKRKKKRKKPQLRRDSRYNQKRHV